MKTEILVRAEPFDTGWIASAYGGRERVIATCQARSEDEFVADLRATLEDYLATEAKDYLTEMSYAGDRDVPNCPAGFIKRPVDLWGCKIKRQTCPIQAQVFIAEPDKFLAVAYLMNLRAWTFSMRLGRVTITAFTMFEGVNYVRGARKCAETRPVSATIILGKSLSLRTSSILIQFET